MTVNEDFYNGLVRQQIDLLKYSSGLSRQAAELLKATEEAVERVVVLNATRLAGKPLSQKGNAELLRKMDNDIAEIRDRAWVKINVLLKSELTELASVQSDNVSRLLTDVLPFEADIAKPKKRDLNEKVRATPYEGRVLQDWIVQSRNADLNRISSRFKRSLARGLDAKEVVNSVIGSKNQRGVIRDAWTGSDAVVFTSTNSIQNEAIDSVVEENPWLATEEYLLATLDSATTPYCQSVDGNVYKLGEGPHPPFHFRCRTLRIPHISPDSIGTRPYKAETTRESLQEYAANNDLKPVKSRGALPRGHKTNFDKFRRQRTQELIGEVPEKTTYSQWLRTQSNEFQADALKSERRAALFRKEGLDIEHYVDPNGDYITLDELARKGRI